MSIMDRADVVLVAPPSELYAYEPAPRRNASRRKKAFEIPVVASVDYEQLLVRTALIRSDKYRDGKFLHEIRSIRDVARLLAHLANANQEHFITVPVNNALVPQAVHETGIGPVGHAAVSPVDVFRIVLLTGASAFFVAHNHPSGSSKPSSDDINMTKSVRETANCFGVDLLDSFVVAYEGVRSIMTNDFIRWSEL